MPLSAALIERHCMRGPVLSPGPRECFSECELVAPLPSRPLSGFSLTPGSSECPQPTGLCGPTPAHPVPPVSFYPALCCFSLEHPKPFPAAGLLHVSFLHLECLFLSSLPLAGPSHLRVLSHLQTWFLSSSGVPLSLVFSSGLTQHHLEFFSWGVH